MVGDFCNVKNLDFYLLKTRNFHEKRQRKEDDNESSSFLGQQFILTP